MNPNSASAHERYSEGLQTRGRFDESKAEGERAQELDPLSPIVFGQLEYVYEVMGRYDDAINQCRRALDLYPNAAMFRASMASVYAQKGMYPQALSESDKMTEQDKAVTAENQDVAGVTHF